MTDTIPLEIPSVTDVPPLSPSAIKLTTSAIPPSRLYQTLLTTTQSFMDSMLPAETGTNLPPTMEDLKAIRTPSFRQSWGPSYFAKGRLETPKDVEEFSEHMGGLIPSLDTWENEIQDITIDENALKATVLVHMWTIVKGSAEVHLRTVRMDIVWILKFEEGGGRVESATEFVDGGASEAIKALVMKAREEGTAPGAEGWKPFSS